MATAALFCPNASCNAYFEASGTQALLASATCPHCSSALRKDLVPVAIENDDGQALKLVSVASPVAATADGFSPSARRASEPPIAGAGMGDPTSEVSRFLFKLWQYCDSTPHELELVKALCALYTELGLIKDGFALPLHRDCPHSSACWSDCDERSYPPASEAGISIPWFGTRFSDRRVLAVATNFNSYGGIGAQWWVRREAIRRLRNGKRGRFYYGGGCYLAAVSASLRGDLPRTELPTADDAAEGWLDSAFTEAIRCSPRTNARGRPQPVMWEHCPPSYFEPELEVLSPKVIILMAREVGDRFKKLFPCEQTAHGKNFERFNARIGAADYDVLCCAHPSSRYWRPAYGELVDSLRARPLTSEMP